MPRKQRPPLDPLVALQRIAQSGLPTTNHSTDDTYDESLQPLDIRIRKLLGIVNDKKRTEMLFFVMYDIESNKVRRYIVKYLEKKGCHRVQKSIFLANLPPTDYDQIRSDLTEVQQAYDNNDSILVVPITSDMLGAMKIIGQNINLDIITHSKTTLFF